MRINFSEVQRNVSEIANRQLYTIDVLYELMAAYGRSAASITKLRSGNLNLTEDKETSVLQRGVVYFKVVKNSSSLPAEVEKLEQDPLTQRYNPRFLIATDLKTFAAKDTKKGNPLQIEWANIDKNVDFFYGWTGDEVTDEKTEAAADRRAADKMKELYQELEKVNLDKFKNKFDDFRHHLNVFFTRLLFCFFAEDTRVFSKEDTYIFTGSIKEFTLPDGSDLDQFLGTLFESLDEEDKSKYTSPFSKFPYVNGKIFSKKFNIEIPKFNAQARKLILDCGALNWAEINPDIFGSMFQSIVDEEHRSTHGMHYTSVPNIMKTIEPLFLDELRDEFDKYYDIPKQLQNLHDRISKIKVFDPACGSGNFLIIAYKELRKLEHAIIDRLYDEDFKRNALAGKLKSRIELDNFYGIEIDDFACEVAVLSLYLAKHQMNIEFEKQFGREIKLIPLKDKANIIHGNATRIDWQEVCPNKLVMQSFDENQQQQLIATELSIQQTIKEDIWKEIYIIGNPQYRGFKLQNESQKADIKHVFSHRRDYKKLDYISCWFYLATEYIKGTKASYAFVSTNSVSQGEHVGLLWADLLQDYIEISFAYQSFKWINSAKDNAGVACVVVGVRNIQNKQKLLFTDNFAHNADNINAYLVDGPDIIIRKRSKPLSDLPRMMLGNMPKDDGEFLLDSDELSILLTASPDAERFIRPIVGAEEFLQSVKKWCIWILPHEKDLALRINNLKDRITRVKEFRLKSTDKSANKMAETAFMFREQHEGNINSIIIPTVTSERREYIPIGLLSHETIVVAPNNVIYDPELFLFSILSSKMHVVWVKAVAGRLETRIRYSSALAYNNFPIKKLSILERSQLEKLARSILLTRQNYTEKTLAEMYDPNKMPSDLREAHHQNDIFVDKLYRHKPYTNDEERLADLLKLYEEMVAKEKE